MVVGWDLVDDFVVADHFVVMVGVGVIVFVHDTSGEGEEGAASEQQGRNQETFHFQILHLIQAGMACR
jgi:hypothetical protein